LTFEILRVISRTSDITLAVVHQPKI